MNRLHNHLESHLIQRIGWLRAAVLGANDGIVSTASLIVGVASSAARVVNGGEAARFLVTLKFDLERPS
jgi:VIT1/CCC1 family predicted Fe2+/Mn2+ transporter